MLSPLIMWPDRRSEFRAKRQSIAPVLHPPFAHPHSIYAAKNSHLVRETSGGYSKFGERLKGTGSFGGSVATLQVARDRLAG